MLSAISLTSTVGYAAAFFGTFVMLPQVLKSYRTKSVADISWGMIFMYLGNCTLWLVYGLRIASEPLVITNAAALVLCFVLAALKYQYR